MGFLSIALGIIAFVGFIGAGAVAAENVVGFIVTFSKTFTTLEDVNQTIMRIGVVGIFGFIGLLVGMTLIMLGLNYNKLGKLEKRRKHRRNSED